MWQEGSVLGDVWQKEHRQLWENRWWVIQCLGSSTVSGEEWGRRNGHIVLTNEQMRILADDERTHTTLTCVPY